MPAAETVADALQHLPASLSRARVVHSVHLSAACLFVYDHLTTFSEEVDLVWTARWGPGKILFLLARYPAWPELLSTMYIELFDVRPSVCHGVFTYMTWSVILGIAASEIILVLRTWAIWNGMRYMLLSLGLLLLSVFVAACYLVAFYISESTFISASSVAPGLSGCVLRSSTQRVALAWIIFTAFELLIVVLTLVKGIEHFKHGSSSNLLTSLYRDGIIYFICMFAISVANVTVVYTTPAEYLVLLSFMQRSFHSIFACRIILHIQAAARGPAETTGRFTCTLLHEDPSWYATRRASAWDGRHLSALPEPLGLEYETPEKTQFV
ncbi:hypothetical protein AURDEDRAFT_146763 [Auricularia subglabra TFB-10046 SS5]|nr:hypothetical protein AURDEDRAFT_146763 [Auricularia subglabra TFB-10046 SS5]